MICPLRAPKQRRTESFNNQTNTNELPIDDNSAAAVLAALLDTPRSSDPPGPRKSRRPKVNTDRMAAHKQELATANTKIKKKKTPKTSGSDSATSTDRTAGKAAALQLAAEGVVAAAAGNCSVPAAAVALDFEALEAAAPTIPTAPIGAEDLWLLAEAADATMMEVDEEEKREEEEEEESGEEEAAAAAVTPSSSNVRVVERCFARRSPPRCFE